MHFHDIIKLNINTPVYGWAMDTDGRRIAALGKNRIFQISGGDGDTIQCCVTIFGPWCGSIRSPDFERYGIVSVKLDKGVLAFCCKREHIFRWGYKGTKPVECHEAPVTSFASQGDCYITASDDCTIQRWNRYDGKVLAKSNFDVRFTSHMLYQAQDNLLIVIRDNGEAALFDATNLGEPLLRWFPHVQMFYGVPAAPILMKKTLLVTAGNNGLITVWDTARGKWGDGKIEPVMSILAKQVTAMCTAVDDEYLVTASQDGLIRIHDTITGRFILSSTFLGHIPDQIASFHHERVSDYSDRFIGNEFDLIWSSGGQMYCSRVHSAQWMWKRGTGFVEKTKPICY